MKSEFRTTCPQDADAVTAFIERIYGLDSSFPLIAPQHLHWKCWEPRSDWPGSRGYVITKEGVIVAHGTVVPLSLVSAGRHLKMLHLIDWAADPKSVGSGVTLLKHLAQFVDAVIIVGGSAMTQKILPALGFKTCGEATNFVRPVRPLKRLAGQPVSAQLGAQFARSALWSLQAPSVRTEGWTVRRIEPDQLQTLKWRPPGQGIAMFERTAAAFAYFLKCPVTPMELYSVGKGDGVSGYFMLAHAPGQTRIVDCHIDSEDREAWRVLLQLAVSQAKRNPATAEVVAIASDPSMHQALLDSGFHARGGSSMRLLPGKGIEVLAGPIRFQMIDSDAAYLHANRPAYWA